MVEPCGPEGSEPSPWVAGGGPVVVVNSGGAVSAIVFAAAGLPRRAHETPAAWGNAAGGIGILHSSRRKSQPVITEGFPMHIRRTTHWKFDQPISLPFIAAIADEHPETTADAPPPAPPAPAVKERRGATAGSDDARAHDGQTYSVGAEQAQAGRVGTGRTPLSADDETGHARRRVAVGTRPD